MSSCPSYAIIIPVYRERLTDAEQLAFTHLDHYLPHADKCLVMPESLEFRREGYREARFADRYFDGIPGYNRLMLSPAFYARFRTYAYVLIHQLDALVFHSDIERFLRLDVDYLGAPWVEHDAGGRPVLTRVGNGGLSLRRVDGFLRLLDSPPPKSSMGEYYRRRYSDGSRKYRLLGIPRTAFVATGAPTAVRRAAARLRDAPFHADLAADARVYSQDGAAEDRFISLEAKNYWPGFRFANIDDALGFAFEQEPRFCYAQAGRRMPFGTHAWERYDRSFWEPYLLR